MLAAGVDLKAEPDEVVSGLARACPVHLESGHAPESLERRVFLAANRYALRAKDLICDLGHLAERRAMPPGPRYGPLALDMPRRRCDVASAYRPFECEQCEGPRFQAEKCR